jgi:hypothetical protein
MKALRVFAMLASLTMITTVHVCAETEPFISYGPSPAQTVQRVLRPQRILRINVVEPYAIVSARGTGPLFDLGPSAEFVLEQFDFGWQIVEMAPSLCARERGLTASEERRLMAGMPKQSARYHNCSELDSGPKRSIAQVRKLMHGPVVPFVRVYENYAFSVDYSDGGGCGLFRYEPGDNRWKLLGGCKGAMETSVITDNHVPHAVVCALRPAIPTNDLNCPRKKP